MPLTPSFSISGKVNWSLDGAPTGGSFQAVVPEGSTIVAAFLYGSTYAGSVTAAQLGGMAVTGFTSLGATGQLRAFRADVTGIVSTLLGDGDAAAFNLAVSLTTGSGLNGFALAIVYSNPLEQARTITFLDGASATTGDQFTINYGAPLDTAAPGFEATMSLGIGFSAQPSGQISTIDVNGTRLTSSAGGQDDSSSLVTIGGIGDSITNPSAYANDSGGFRTDDELYDLRPFLVAGAISTTIATRNPSNDDLIFFAGINVTAVASVVIPGANAAPVANDDTATTTEDSSVLVNVLANDTDADSNTLTISSASVTTGSGTATIESGQVRYDPGSAYNNLAQGAQATAIVTYAISDGNGGSDSGALTVTITGANDGPVVTTAAGNNAGAVTEAGNLDNGTVVAGTPTVSKTLTASDADAGATMSWTGNAGGTYGSFAITSGGVWTYTLDNGRAATQALNEGQSVTESFTATVTDDKGATASQVVTVTVNGTNDAPQIVAGGLPGIDLIAGAPASYVWTVGEPDTAYYAQTFTATSATLTGIAVPLDWTGGDGPADLRLLITTTRSDGSGFHPDQVLFQSAAISVPVDDDEGFTIFSVDFSGLALTPGAQYAIILDGKALVDGITGLGSWQEGTDYAAGSFFYLNTSGSPTTRSADFAQSWTSYSSGFDAAFRLSTGSTTTGAVTEAGSLDNGTPVAGTTSAAGTIVATDVDQGDVLTWSGSANGSYGSFAINAQGSWTYTLDNGRPGTQALAEGQVATEAFTVTVTDLAGATDTETVTITVNGTNDAPVISDDGTALRSLFEPGFDGNGAARGSFQTVGQFFASDVDAGATLTWSVVGGGDSQLGALSINQNGVWTYTLDGVAADSLALGQLAVETFAVRVTDGQGAYDDREVRIEITGSNDAPSIVDVTGQFIVGEATDGSAQENVVVHAAGGQIRFGDADLGDSHGASFAPAASGYLGTFGIGPVNGAGKSVGWTFSVPDSALDGLASGEIVAQTYDLTVTDANGLSVMTPVTVLLYGSNDAALLSSANVVVAQSNVPATASGDLSISDVDGPELFQAQTGTVGQYGTFAIDADGQWTYQAASANLGLAPGESLTDLFMVYAADGTPTSVSVTVTGSADGGVARPDMFVTDEASALGAGLNLFADNGFGADSDPDNPLQIVSVAGGPVGQLIQMGSGALLRVNADGTFSYDPNDAFNTLNQVAGSANQLAYDTFSYTLSDGSSTVVTIKVNGLNSPEDVILGQPASGEYLNNVIFGTSGNDRFMLQPGGTRGAYGNEGNDGFYFGAALGSQYLVDGGAGIDTLALQGNYPGLVIGAEVTDVEVLLVLSGSDARFGDNAGASYDYDITTVDANVAAGKILTVQASGLLPGEDLVFDGSAESDGAFRIFAGQGDDVLTGGAGNDGFFFGADGNLTGADRIVGGPGTDSLALRGNYVGADAVVLEDASLSGIEVVVLLSGHTSEFGGTIVPGGFDYDLTLANGNVAAGQRLDIIATNLGADESVRIDGRAELDGSLRILSGAGDDQLFGGAGADTLSGGLGADAIDGGAGADLYLYRSALESTAAARDTLTFSAGDRIDLSSIDSNAGTAANEAFSFIGGAAFGGVAGELRASLQGGQWIVEGDVNGDGLADLMIAVGSGAPLTVADFTL